MELTGRQQEIVELVKRQAPITGEQIAESLGVSRPTIRSDLSILVMLGLIDAKPKVGYFPGEAFSSAGHYGERVREMKVEDVMSPPVVIRSNATVNEAVVILFRDHVGLISVIDEADELVGIVSVKDLLKVTLGNPNAAANPIQMVMTRLPRVATVTPDDSVLEAARKMIVHQVGGLPVVRPLAHPDDRLTVVGRISKTNVTQLFIEMA